MPESSSSKEFWIGCEKFSVTPVTARPPAIKPIARQKGAHLTVTAVPCAALTLDRAEALHGGALELAWGEIAEG